MGRYGTSQGEEGKERTVISLRPRVAEGENVFVVCHILAFLSVCVSFVGGFPLPGGILVFPASTHSFFMVSLLRAIGVCMELSLIHTPWLMPVVSVPS